MKVLFNATDGPLSTRAVKRYIQEFVLHMAQADPLMDIEFHIVFFTHRRSMVREFMAQIPQFPRERIHQINLPRAWSLKRYQVPRIETRWLSRQFDLYHESTTDHPFLEGVHYLTTVHGLVPVVRPDILPAEFVAEKQQWFERACALSTHFAPVSEMTRNELLQHFPVAPQNARAVPLGISDAFRPSHDLNHTRQQLKQELGINGNYLLYVGGIQANKNIELTLATFDRLVEDGCFDGDLVLAGDLHYSADKFAEMLSSIRHADRVRLTGYMDPYDPRLPLLYQAASLFLFPSLYEGWTSPPLEAMACGSAALCSNLSSIPESCGDAATLCDPADSETWFSLAAELLSNRGLRERQIARGFDWAGQFPWSRTVERTLQFYQDIEQQKTRQRLSQFAT